LRPSRFRLSFAIRGEEVEISFANYASALDAEALKTLAAIKEAAVKGVAK
jgi:hypothetical protein